MKISKIRISNILGIDELEFSPAGFTEISGQNGTGKTSVLEAIKSALSSGNDATLLRKGAEKGEAVLVLDDGTEIKKRVTQDSCTTEVRRAGKKVQRPADAIKHLTDLLSVNPVDFLRAPKKDRMRVLLEAMPIEADTEKLAEIVGFDVEIYPGTHALHAIETVHKQVYDIRTGTNRAVREKQATIKQLKDAIPPVPAGADGDETTLRSKLEDLDRQQVAEMERISGKLESLRQERDAKIEELRKQAAAINEEFSGFERKASIQREKAKSKISEEKLPIMQQLTIIVNNREVAARRQQTLDTIATLETELETLVTDAESQTHALGGIEKYKSELLQNLPIQGLEVRDGEIYRDNVPLDRLNTAQQVDIAVQLAMLRAGELGVICVDGVELLDSESYEEFRKRALESDLQMFVTRVGDNGFEISTTN